MARSQPPAPVPETSDAAARRAYALGRADEQISWYESHSARQWLAFSVFQSAAVVLGGLTPVLILWTALPKVVQALPAALAAVAAGLVGIFRWPDNKARYSYTAEALKSERIRFATRTGPHYGGNRSDEEALDRFVSRIEEIAMAEVAEWRAALGRRNDEGPADADPSS